MICYAYGDSTLALLPGGARSATAARAERTEAADPRHLQIPLQGHFANQDDWCTPQAVNALEATLKDAKAHYELFRYDAQHGFFNEQRPEVYNAEASQQAWERMRRFLNAHL